MSGAFRGGDFLPARLLEAVTDKRVADPEFPLRAAGLRIRRESLAPSGKLNILAADHPARRVTKAGDNLLAMADRHDYLARILRVVVSDRVDGLMATMDILEDLLAIDGLIREAGSAPLLDGKVLIASLNRGGMAGSAWELDDPVTGPSPATCAAWHLDGAKLLMRIAEDDPASLKTMLASARAVTEANALRLPVFLEPLPVKRDEKGFQVAKNATELARIVGVASALGDSSRYLWLKLPYCDGYNAVARATTLPILLLGGETAGDPEPFLRQLKQALAAGSNVRGALVGRNVLYPGDEDPLAMSAAAGRIIHNGWTVDEALGSMAEIRGRDMDYLSRRFQPRASGRSL